MATAIAALTFSACSESDTEHILSVDPSVSEGIVAELDGGFYKIPVTASKDWTARFEDDCDWASLLDEAGKGPGFINVCVDANFAGIGRKTNVLISSGDKTVAVPISQRTPDTNDETSLNYAMIASSKGVGYGFNMSKFEPSRVAVFNLIAIDSLMKQDPVKYYGLFNSDVKHEFTGNITHIDSIQNKQDSLGVSLSFNINYGLFHLGVKAHYVGKEDRRTDSKSYKYEQSIPMMTASVSFEDIMAHYSDWLDEGGVEKLENGKTDYRSCLLQTGIRRKLKALEDPANDSSKRERAAQDIFSSVGPALIVGTTLGGSLAMQLYVDSIYFHEVMALDTAHVDVAFKSGLFSLDANVDVGYKKTATEHLEHSICEVDIHGGNSTKSSDLGDAFGHKQFEKLDTLFHAWSASLKVDNDKNQNTASIINVDLIPIWVLVDPYSPARDYLRTFIINKVKAFGNKQLLKVFEDYPY